jgi:VCBS repeat-containing protein
MATITTSGLVTSWTNTPQAGDDSLAPSGLGEDATAVFYLDVMVNDLGGKAKTLYSLDDGVENQDSATSPDLLTGDLVGSDNFSRCGALIEITADGKVAYSMTEQSRAQFQSLGAGEVGQDSFTYAIRLASGALSWATVSVSITGSNDGPVVAVTDVTGAATEMLSPAGELSDSGSIAFGDVDLSDTHSVGAVTASTGALGTLSASVTSDTTGSGTGGVISWNYSVAASAVEYLAKDETKVETFTFTLDDGQGGTVECMVSVTLTGTNDALVIQFGAGDSAAATLSETDSGLNIGGALSVTDVDLSDSVSAAVTAVSLGGAAGALTAADVLGFLTLSPASGLAANPGDAHNLGWNFDSGTQAFNYLHEGESLTLAYTIEASDGNGGTATQQVSITINGTADGPTGIVLTGIAPGGNNVPSGSIGQFTAVGATGNVAYSATLVEKTLAGVVQADGTPDISVSTSGLVTAASGPTGFEEGRIYELNVTASDSGGSLMQTFRVVTGSTNGETINLAAIAGEDLVFLAGGNDAVLAGAGNDTVFGQNGADLIHGGDGHDVLCGMNGADTFFFDTPLNAASNVDTVKDFNASNNASSGDTLYLSTAQFTGIGSGAGALAAADFQQVSSGGTGDVSTLSVQNGVNIVYDASTDSLYFDADGGSLANATQFAVVQVVGGTFDNGDIRFGV